MGGKRVAGGEGKKKGKERKERRNYIAGGKRA